MLQELGIGFSDLSAGAIVVLTVLLLLTGRLVPRSVLKDVRDDRDTRVQEARTEMNYWKDANEASQSTVRELSGQVNELLEYARTTDSFIKSLPRVLKAAEDDR